ncbi:MAG: lysophospholipid acyltransferase family protein [Vulcanimicrobiota bacterium]
MLDLQWLREFHFGRRPWGQLFIARVLLELDFRRSHTHIVLEGAENLPSDGGAFLAMNHTDRFNYMPFMYKLDRLSLPPAAPWVKGKYYQKRWLGRILNLCDCIPVPSRGFIISLDFKRVSGHAPSAEQYRLLRDLVDGQLDPSDLPDDTRLRAFITSVEGEAQKPFLEYFHDLFARMAEQVVRINREALERGYMPLVFPQGTRSRRLSRGYTGLAQVAGHVGASIIPVGVSGADRLYPDSKPFSRGGTVIYRVGQPLRPDGPELAPFRVETPYVPLSLEAGRNHQAKFEGQTEVVMDAINQLLEPDYQYSDDRASDGVSGVRRFL